MNALEMSGAGKRYKGFALENVNLVLPEGCILGLIGENGAGENYAHQAAAWHGAGRGRNPRVGAGTSGGKARRFARKRAWCWMKPASRRASTHCR